MNFKQLTVLWVGILIIVANCLYVPFVNSENNISKGYYPIWEPPIEEKAQEFKSIEEKVLSRYLSKNKTYIKFEIDFSRLSLQIGIVAIVFIGLIITVATKKNNKQITVESNNPVTNSGKIEPQKKKSIMDDPRQRSIIAKMGTVYKVTKPDNDDKENK